MDHLSDEELAPRRVKLASINSPHNQAIIKKIQSAGYDLYIWDISSEFGIPVYSAYIDDKKHIRGLGMFAGYGAHLSKEVALSRAITEAVQSRLTYISGARDDIGEAMYKKNKEHANYSSVETIDYSATKNLVLPSSFADCAQLVIGKLKQQGIKLFILSNNFAERAKYYEENFPWLKELFEKVYYSWQTGFIKPDPRCWQTILAENNLAPADCVYFDDSPANIQTANNRGIKSLLFTNVEDVKVKLHCAT